MTGCDKLLDLHEIGDVCPQGYVLENNACVQRLPNHYTCSCECRSGSTLEALTPLDVCMPPEINPNLNGSNQPPSAQVLITDCESRVLPVYEQITGEKLGSNFRCTCDAENAATGPSAWAPICDAPCDDPSGVCVASGPGSSSSSTLAAWFAPASLGDEVPIANPLAAALFTPISTCEVTGTARIEVDGEQPQMTGASGLVHFYGRPCPPGQPCQVGVSYRLTANPIRIEKLFGSETLEHLSIAGASEPGAVNLAFLGVGGSVLPDALLSGARGRQSGKDHVVIVGRNPTSLPITANWSAKTCSLEGTFVGGTDSDVTLVLGVEGQLTNQPPRARAGSDETLECTSPYGAAVNLSASASTDPDDDIIAYGWRLGGPAGNHVVDPSGDPALNTQQALGQAEYYVEVVDSKLAADSDSVLVTVEDTTPPVISCNAPSTIYPTEAPVEFTATAADACGPSSAVTLDSFSCFEVKPGGRIVDKKQSCKVRIEGDTIRIDDSGGVNTIIRWVARAADAAGNVGSRACELTVIRPPDR